MYNIEVLPVENVGFSPNYSVLSVVLWYTVLIKEMFMTSSFFALIVVLLVQINKMHLVIEFIIPKFIEGSTCFKRHSAHHQELQTVFAVSSLYTHVVTDRCASWVGNGSSSHPAWTTTGHHMCI
jgi:hypothetical protein